MAGCLRIKTEDLSYPQTHRTCNSHAVDVGVDFSFRELKQGCIFGFEQTPAHQLLIFLEGSCTMRYDNLSRHKFSAGQMILVRRYSCYSGYADENLKLLVMSFEGVLGECDKLTMETYNVFRTKIHYDFRPTAVRFPLTSFCTQLVYLLQNGMNCAHLHELKHRELFLLLRSFYTKEEITYLFYEIIGTSFDFRRAIYENCDKVTSIAGLIQLLNMSRSLFFRRFRQEFGVTAYQWMLKHRREQIIRTIVDPNVRIDDLYERFGYASKESFHNFCKKEFKCTPRQLIEQYRRLETSPGIPVSDRSRHSSAHAKR